MKKGKKSNIRSGGSPNKDMGHFFLLLSSFSEVKVKNSRQDISQVEEMAY
jgi:hypothetical protein